MKTNYKSECNNRNVNFQQKINYLFDAVFSMLIIKYANIFEWFEKKSKIALIKTKKKGSVVLYSVISCQL